MVTKKEDATSKVSRAVAEQANIIEEMIEQRITEGELRISLGAGQLPAGTKLVVLHEVARRYREAGWETTAQNDQRDGMYITIS